MTKTERIIFYIMVHSAICIAIILPVSYVYFTFKLNASLLPFIILSLFGLTSLYGFGDSLGQRTSNYTIKRIAAITMGTVSIGFPIGCIGLIIKALQMNTIWIGICLLSAWAALVILSIILEQLPPTITQKTLNLNSTVPLHVIHISDLHLNGLNSAKKIKRWVEKINQLQPDVIVFTGDLLDIPKECVKQELAELAKLTAKFDKLAVSGNHEFYFDSFNYPEVLASIGFKYLDNMSITIQTTQFIGLPDITAKRKNIYRQKLSQLIKDPEQNQPVILLDHRPDGFRHASHFGISLQLSGHTHGGQLPPWKTLIRLKTRFISGLYKLNNSYIYTNRGTNGWGPPMRLFKPSEITSIHLK